MKVFNPTPEQKKLADELSNMTNDALTTIANDGAFAIEQMLLLPLDEHARVYLVDTIFYTLLEIRNSLKEDA